MENIFKLKIMKEQNILIKNLLKLNNSEINDDEYWEHFDERMELQNSIMEQLTENCRKDKTLYGRILRFPTADSYAVYVIDRVLKNIVHLSWIKYCDEWTSDIVEAQNGTMDIRVAQTMIQQEDRMYELFNPMK